MKDMTVWKRRVAVTWERIRRHFRLVRTLVAVRSPRASQVEIPLRMGWRPQDIAAIFLLTVGCSVVALDIPSHDWIRSLPDEYLQTFGAFTDLGKAHWILWPTGLFCIWLLSLETERFRFRLRMAVGAAFTYAGFIFYTVAASGVLALVLKWSLGRARPKLYEQVGPVEFDIFAFHGSYTSFPSGHSTTVGAFAAALAFLFPTWRWLIGVCGFWVAFSRCFVGAHYPSDVIAGTMLGVIFTFFTVRYLAKRRIGFRFNDAGTVEPIMSTVSASACMRLLWDIARGRTHALREPESAQDDLPPMEQPVSGLDQETTEKSD